MTQRRFVKRWHPIPYNCWENGRFTWSWRGAEALGSHPWWPRSQPGIFVAAGTRNVMDRSLFAGSADRTVELEGWSEMPAGRALVDIAVTHELGHALCKEKNERLANEYGKELREGKIPNCKYSSALEGGLAIK